MIGGDSWRFQKEKNVDAAEANWQHDAIDYTEQKVDLFTVPT